MKNCRNQWNEFVAREKRKFLARCYDDPRFCTDSVRNAKWMIWLKDAQINEALAALREVSEKALECRSLPLDQVGVRLDVIRALSDVVLERYRKPDSSAALTGR